MATLSVGGTAVFDEAVLQSGVTGTGITSGTITSGVTFPAGHIIQVAPFTGSYTAQTTGDTNEHDIEQSSGVAWEPQITVASGNKILIHATLNTKMSNSTGADTRAKFKLYQKIGSGAYAVVYENSDAIGGYDYGGSGLWFKNPFVFTLIMNPNSAELIKYKMSHQKNESAAYFNFNSEPADHSEVILMEVTT